MLPNAEINPLAPDQSGATSLNLAESNSSESRSSYKNRLNRWAIVRTESTETHVVARFRSHSDADGHLQLLRQKFSDEEFTIVFEKQPLRNEN
ncbi:MAG: hypothetical protein NW224_25460 [Leptolyngbyaceae cyanobacterium bins.302]|nr:hypothetical protein [Leptolyngbyaceae cyanobacterium bins.302]